MKKLMAKQHRLGLIMVIIGALSILPEKDLTFALVAVPLGIWMMATKNCILWSDEK